MDKGYSCWNGCEWEQVSTEWLDGVKLDGLVEIYNDGRGISCLYNNGEWIHYNDCFGTWGFPTVLR